MSARAAGFSVIELLIAMAIMITCGGVVLALVVAGQSMARIQPEAADQQQRARTALQALGAELVQAGAGLDRGPQAGPLARFFAPVSLSADGGLTTWYVSSARAQATLRDRLDASATIAPLVSQTCPGGQPACAFSPGTDAIVFSTSGCHDVVRIVDVLPADLVLRAGSRSCVYEAGAAIAEGEVRTFRVDVSARQLVRRDESTGATSPVLDNVGAMDIELLDAGRRVRLTLRFVAVLLKFPDFVLTLDASPVNLALNRSES